ncbi:hypothetical protein [Salibacterium aidingense]|uniref:hypothetical protein n=1 Tax=Salibacterium aidingense TaxID=384933 RepID=UPI003BE2108D
MATAYQNARDVFNTYFAGSKGHLDTMDDYENPDTGEVYHDGAHFMRLALDIQFLSVLEYFACHITGENQTFKEAGEKLNEAIEKLHLKWREEGMDTVRPFDAPGMSLTLQAMIYAKRYNYKRLKSVDSPVQTMVDELYHRSKENLEDEYLHSIVQDSTRTFRQHVLDQEYREPSTYTPYFSTNIVALYGASLALDSYLITHQQNNDKSSAPADYPLYGRIEEIGYYIKAMNYNHQVEGREGKVGGGESSSRRNEIHAGYNSWVAWSIAQMAFGLVYPPSIADDNDSVFFSESREMQDGFTATYYRSNKTVPFIYDRNGTIMDGGNAVGYLYPMVFAETAGSDSFLPWLDEAVYAYCEREQIGSPFKDAIVRICEIDHDTTGSFFHRALTGLTMGMLRGLTFSC